MKKEVIILFLIGMLLISPLVLAQEEAEMYSGFNRFTNNVQLFFSGGENKVQVALEIREKEIDSAIINSQNQNEKDAIKNLEKAHKKLQVVNDKISLESADDVKVSVDEVINKIEEEENLSENFDVYVLEEKRTQLTAELTQKTYEYCKALSQEDYNAMLREEKCNPKTAPKNLEKELKELKQIQKDAFYALMLEIRSCIDDPGTCNCEANVDIEQKAKCEKMVALAVKCEYKNDTSACKELILMKPVEGDGFAESFVPNSSIELFEQYREMIDYNIQKSDGVPPECYNENERVKTECAQYRYLKELHPICFDKEGNFLVEECGGPKDTVPTMQESIPQCFDENNEFMMNKCGKVTIVWNEEGLINYLFEGGLNNTIEEFENKSEQHIMEIRKGWMMVENKWVIDEGQANGENWTNTSGQKIIDVNGTLGQAVRVIEGNITDIEEDIETWVVDHPAMNVDGDEGLTWEIKVDVAGTSSGGGGSSGNNVVDDSMCEEGEENCNNDVAPGPQGIVGNQGDGSSGGDAGNEVVDNVVASGGGNGGSGVDGEPCEEGEDCAP